MEVETVNSKTQSKLIRILSQFGIAFTLGFLSVCLIPSTGNSSDYTVYSVYKELDMGNPGEVPQKDYYINMGSSQGIRVGTSLTVKRRIATYDLLSEKLYKDLVVPVAKIKVIHVESNAAVARLEKLESSEKSPAISPRAVLIGDIVQFGQSESGE
jgi:hypothetical protein